MQSLKRIEALPPARRSSMVGQAGVLNDLRALDKQEAISWLQRNISSPVTRDWGKLLVGVAADWNTLKAWMHIDKEHALAAADAVDHLIAVQEEWPADGVPSEVVAETERIATLYQTPKLKSILDAVLAFSTPQSLPHELNEGAKLLLGESEPQVILKGNSVKEKWHSLFHKADKKHCVAILDWRSSESECTNQLLSLPIVVESDKSMSSHLVYEKVDVGSDEVILVALPEADMKALKKLTPKSFKYQSYVGAA